MSTRFQGLKIRSHADRIVDRVVDLLRRSTYLAGWEGLRVVRLADIHTRPDLPFPLIGVALQMVAPERAIGQRTEDTVGVLVTAMWEEFGTTLEPSDSSSVVVYEALRRTLTSTDEALCLHFGTINYGRWRRMELVNYGAIPPETEDGETLLGRIMDIEVEYEHDTDQATGHPPGLTDTD